jgi:hypothetical protein
VQLASSEQALGGEVVPLHAAWADALAASGHGDAAASHYVEAGDTAAAARAALAAGSLARAAALVDALPPQEQDLVAGALADAFRAAGGHTQAAAYYACVGKPAAAVHMYFDAGQWDEARKVRRLPKQPVMYS